MKRLWTEHPASVGETYFQHLCSAWYFAANMALGTICCFVHGLFPFLFQKSGSARVAHLHDRMIVNRSRLTAIRPSAPPNCPIAGSAGATDLHPQA